MSNECTPNTDPNGPMVYQIRIRGHLGPQWAGWFGDLTITLEENGDTLLTGRVVDQAALYGLLRKLRDVGLPLISINPAEPGPVVASEINQDRETEPSRRKKNNDYQRKCQSTKKDC